MLADGRSAQRRGEMELGRLAGLLPPLRCADGYVTLGALEPKFWQAYGAAASGART